MKEKHQQNVGVIKYITKRIRKLRRRCRELNRLQTIFDRPVVNEVQGEGESHDAWVTRRRKENESLDAFIKVSVTISERIISISPH